MTSFTGLWELNNAECVGQKALLTAMGRAAWQIRVIENAKETFRLMHYSRVDPSGKKVHFFKKNVHIYLDSGFLKIISALIRIPFNQITYECEMIADTKKVQHPDDAKQFGECSSVTSWVEKDGRSKFVIRWYLKQGLLKVHHVVKQNKLFAYLSFTDRAGKETTSMKVYDKTPFRPTDREYMCTDPDRAILV